jgi:hypothetical protein
VLMITGHPEAADELARFDVLSAFAALNAQPH